MSIKHIITLFNREVIHGPKDVTFIMVVVTPILISLFISLAFGNIFSEKPKLGLTDLGNSQLVSLLKDNNTLLIKEYPDEAALKEAATSGAVDMGLVLPADFDTTLLQTNTLKSSAYVWGESLAKNRMIIPAVLADTARQITGAEVPVEINSISLGDEQNVPWSDRLFPFVVLMAMFFSGLMLPASSLIDEKQKRTLEAVNITPATLGEIFTAKGAIGTLLGLIMGLIILGMNSAFGNAPLPLVLMLVLGSLMASLLGLLAGAFIKDMNTLFAVWKFGGLLLFGPAFIYLFPQIPQWIGYFFPTYYILKPVVDLSIYDASWSDIALNAGITMILVAILLAVVSNVVKRMSNSALRLYT